MKTVLIDMELARLGMGPDGGKLAVATQGLRAALFRLRAGGVRVCWVGDEPDFFRQAQDAGLVCDTIILGARHTKADAYVSARLWRLDQAEHIEHRAWVDAGLPQAGHVLDERVAIAHTVAGWVDQYLLSQGIRPTLMRVVASIQDDAEGNTPSGGRAPKP